MGGCLCNETSSWFDVERSLSGLILPNIVFYSGRDDSVLMQLLRISVCYHLSNKQQYSISSDPWKCLFLSWVNEALPKSSKESPEQRINSWILGYFPVFICGRNNGKARAVLVIDRTALYLIMWEAPGRCGSCMGCCSKKTQLCFRFPFLSLFEIGKDPPGEVDKNGKLPVESFYFNTTMYINDANVATIFNWNRSGGRGTVTNSIRLQSPRTDDILFLMHRIHSALTVGEPYNPHLPHQQIKWKNLPLFPQPRTDPAPQLREMIAKDEGFYYKFLSHLLFSSLCADDAAVVPPEWLAKQPQYLHLFHTFNKDHKGVKPPIPRSPLDLLERIPIDSILSVELATKQNWIAVLNKDRLASQIPLYKCQTLIRCIGGKLLDRRYDNPNTLTALTANATRHTPGILQVLDLHGAEYKASSANVLPNPVVKAPSNIGDRDTEPAYCLLTEYDVLAGDVPYYGVTERAGPPGTTEACRERPCNPGIATAALRALPYARIFNTLSFQGCVLTTIEGQKQALAAMVDVCRYNTYLNTIAFPPINTSGTHPQSDIEAWAAIGAALWSNPRPLFTGLDFYKSNLGNSGVLQVLPAMERLFGASQRAIPPVCLRFDHNGLNNASVEYLCRFLLGEAVPTAGILISPMGAVQLDWLQELSFGCNPWCNGQTVIVKVLEIIQKCTLLKVLNLESSSGTFPVTMLYLTLEKQTPPCPLSVLKLAGCRIAEAEADNFVDMTRSIAGLKSNTIQYISIRGAYLPSAPAIRLISSLPHIDIDFSGNGIGDHSRESYLVNPDAKMRSLLVPYAPSFAMLFWGKFPSRVIKIDFTGIGRNNVIGQYSVLAKSFQGVDSPIALKELSVAKVKAGNPTMPLNPVQNFIEFLYHVLLNPNIKLTTLDITGCEGLDVSLVQIGFSLRTNRSLTCLKMDGQKASLQGWEALRGCLYGNKKLISLSYPYHDCGIYFDFVAQEIKSGWSKALTIKSQIGAAHRSCQWHRKQQLITEIIECKRKFFTLDRSRTKSIRILHAMFSAVEANAAAAVEISANKQAAFMSKQYIVSAKDKMAVKQVQFLTKLQTQLTKFRTKQVEKNKPQQSRESVTAPSIYMQYTQNASIPSPPPINPGYQNNSQSSAYAPILPTAHAASATEGVTDEECIKERFPSAWRDIQNHLSSGPLLFVPENFYQFCALVEIVGGRSDANIGRTLTQMEDFIQQMLRKTEKWRYTPHDMAANLTQSYGDTSKAFKFPKRSKTSKKKKHRSNRRRRDRDNERDNNYDNDNGYDNGYHRDNNYDTDSSCDSVDGGIEDVDYIDNDNDNNDNDDHDGNDNDHNDNDNHGHDMVSEQEHAAEESNVDDAVAMYAGAGPRDLPDGGGPDRRRPLKVRSGARDLSHLWPKKHLCPTVGLFPLRSTSTHTAVAQSILGESSLVPENSDITSSEWVSRMQKRWQQAISSQMDTCVEKIAPVLDYDFKVAYATTALKMPASTNTSEVKSTNTATCCLVTQCSVDRLVKLEAQARSWGGPISAAVYIPTTNTAIRQAALHTVSSLANRLSNDPTYTGVMVLSVLYGHENSPWKWDDILPGEAVQGGPLYPINALRNLAVAATSLAIFSTTSTTTATTTTVTKAKSNDNPDCTVNPDYPTTGATTAVKYQISKKGAEIPLLFLVDVDFLPSPGLLQWVQTQEESNPSPVGSTSSSPSETLVERCARGDMFVIPAFERSLPTTTLNSTKKDNDDVDDVDNDVVVPHLCTLTDVCRGVQEGTVTPFHMKHFSPGHAPTDYNRWLHLAESRLASVSTTPTTTTTTTVSDELFTPYRVQYREYYEPYIILHRTRFVPYDERFRGYGMNKCIHLRALAHSTSNSIVQQQQTSPTMSKNQSHTAQPHHKSTPGGVVSSSPEKTMNTTFYVVPGHFLIADCHARSEAHTQTYGVNSGYRKHIVAALYRLCTKEQKYTTPGVVGDRITDEKVGLWNTAVALSAKTTKLLRHSHLLFSNHKLQHCSMKGNNATNTTTDEGEECI